jgi:hypothetical protein
MKQRRPKGFWNQPAETLAQSYPASDANSAAGYIRISRDNEVIYLHRWLWEKLVGPIPQGHQIDHINGIRTDCRLSNLRCIPQQDNLRNATQRSTNKSGVTGVSFWSTGNAWRSVTYCPNTGKQKIKTFSIAKYGNEKAFDLACAARTEAMNDLIAMGAYTQRHGNKAVIQFADKELVE